MTDIPPITDRKREEKGGEDWRRRGLAPGFMITPRGFIMSMNEWQKLSEEERAKR